MLTAEGFAQAPGADAPETAQPPAGAAAGEAQTEAEREAEDAALPTEAAGDVEPGTAAVPDTFSFEEQPLQLVGRLETLLEMNRLAEEQRFDEALPVAERLIELTEEEFGVQSLEAAEAYQRAALVQRNAEEHELAEQHYLHAVELIRNIDGTFSERAVGPLIGLGDNYQAAGQYLNAITAYNEARTINRRVYGLLNEGQVPILDRITDSFEQLDQYADADQQQLTILNLAERNYPEGSPEHLEALYRYAVWLRESGRYHEERSQYARAMRIIRDLHGKESPYLARPLRETGNSYRAQRLPDNQGISSLRSALEILDLAGGGEALVRAEVLRDVGDWEVAFSKVEPDLSVYYSAWELLGTVENGDDLRRKWFGELHNVMGEPISQRGLSRAPDALRGHVVVQFDLDRFGRTDNVAVARSEPPGFKDEAVTRAVRRWRFRPFMEDGEAVPKAAVALQFNYRYLPDEQVE